MRDVKGLNVFLSSYICFLSPPLSFSLHNWLIKLSTIKAFIIITRDVGKQQTAAPLAPCLMHGGGSADSRSVDTPAVFFCYDPCILPSDIAFAVDLLLQGGGEWLCGRAACAAGGGRRPTPQHLHLGHTGRRQGQRTGDDGYRDT